MAHVEKVNSSEGLVRGTEKNMQPLGTVQGDSTFSSQTETAMCLTGYLELHLATTRVKMVVEGSPHGHHGTKQPYVVGVL